MSARARIIEIYERIEAENGGPALANLKACAEQTARELGIDYEDVRDALMDENGGLFG